MIAPGSVVTVAKNATAFSAVYGLSVVNAAKGCQGELSNGKDSIAIVDNNGLVVDYIDYEDAGDWPNSAGMLVTHPTVL